MAKRKEEKKKPGPPPKPDGERAKVASTKLSPELYAWVTAQGGGSVTRGLRLVVAAAYHLGEGTILGNS